jgi:thioredoxin-like negative regulator of GroEL
MGLMAFDWLKRSPEVRPEPRSRAAGEETIGDLLARKKWSRALTLLRAQFESGNRSPELRLQFADVLVQTGKAEDAIPVLIGVADELAAASRERAIEALRRVERIDPGREDVVMRLATLGVGGR